MTLQHINVHIGEAKTGRGDQQLHTILGSCVGIGFLWKKRGYYGLAHCLMPKSAPGNTDASARYVDGAIHTLINQMSITNVQDIRAIVAGGANMTQSAAATQKNLIGQQNTLAAIEWLDRLKIRIIHEDTGGCEGRKMWINCDTGEFEVRAIPRS
ncbi:MAG: chemotaxis protein CheD [Granulosicoccus sp.]|nr:chemotaxis protein CheD [Granulosicoccus sp.]